MRVVVAHGRARERRRLQRVPAEAGHEVTGCDCSGDALERCRRLRPDVAVVDRGFILTVSIGWAAWEGEAADALLGRADDAVYEAKARGRDRAVGAPATLPRRR